jgi:hypothetical protein
MTTTNSTATLSAIDTILAKNIKALFNLQKRDLKLRFSINKGIIQRLKLGAEPYEVDEMYNILGYKINPKKDSAPYQFCKRIRKMQAIASTAKDVCPEKFKLLKVDNFNNSTELETALMAMTKKELPAQENPKKITATGEQSNGAVSAQENPKKITATGEQSNSAVSAQVEPTLDKEVIQQAQTAALEAVNAIFELAKKEKTKEKALAIAKAAVLNLARQNFQA